MFAISSLPDYNHRLMTTLFGAIDAYDHDFREEGGKRVHSFQCRRCVLYRIAHELLRDSDVRNSKLRESIGTPSDPGGPQSGPTVIT